MPLTSSNAVRQLSDKNSLGTILGQSSTDKIGFYGITSPVAQPVLGALQSSAFTMGTLTASTGGVGFSTAALFIAAVSTITFLQADLAALRSSLGTSGVNLLGN